MSFEDKFLVSGAELECPNGTKTCKLKADKEHSTTKIGNKVFASVKATKKGENLDGFGMCMSEECIGGAAPCLARMVTADKWVNPAVLNLVLEVQGKEEAICREARLLCVFGRANITALTTGQEDPTESEKKFRKYMSEMFGFDDDIIDIMLKVIYAIDEEYPNESERKKAWRFAWLMGSFSYGFGADDRFIEIRNELKGENAAVNYINMYKEIIGWGLAAGAYEDINSKMSREDYFINKLNISEYEYYKLCFHVMVQHEMTSRPANYLPHYMTVGIAIPNKKDKGYANLYKEVWLDFYGKFESGDENELYKKFAKEWVRLYQEYVNMPDDIYNQLLEEYDLFVEYSEIESNIENYLEKNKIDYKLEPIYSDFAHQQILTAAITLDDAAADKVAGDSARMMGMMVDMSTISITAGSLGPPIIPDSADRMSKEAKDAMYCYRTNSAGWLGDIHLADNKMSEDDYKADLDGLNISNLIISEDINTIEAINEYYCALECGTTTREKEFLCNMGSGDASKGYDYIKSIDKMFGNKAEADKTSKEFMEKISVGLE